MCVVCKGVEGWEEGWMGDGGGRTAGCGLYLRTKAVVLCLQQVTKIDTSAT